MYVKDRFKGICNPCKQGKFTTEEFIEKAISIHGDTYGYTNTVYPGTSDKKLTITCRVHGDFLQRVSDHLDGAGCLQCARDAKKDAYTIPLSTWKERLNTKLPHISILTDDAKGYHTYVEFYCEYHGVFTTNLGAVQSNKYLCPECARLAAQEASSKHGLYTPTNLYYVYFPQFNKWKLGISIYDTTKRFTNVPHEFVWSVKGTHQTIARAEYELHKYLKEFQYTGEKLIKDGNTEIYVGNIVPTEEVLYKLLEKLNLKIDGASEW